MVSLLQKKKKTHHVPEPTLEHENVIGEAKTQGSELIQDTVEEFWRKLILGSTESAREQFGIKSGGKKSFGGDLNPGEEVSLKREHFEETQDTSHHSEDSTQGLSPTEVMKYERHQEYYRAEVANVEMVADQKESAERSQQVEAIRMEIRKLISTSKEMESLFKNVAQDVNTVITKPGKYHLHFFEWILMSLRNIRMNLEEGASWTKMFASKKAERKYGNMAKKHGTSFTLSSERSTATQTG